MSVTTTSNVSTQSVIRLLADYELTHSEGEQAPADTSVNERPRATSESNPAWWPTDHHGIPPHRPIDYTLDHEQRPWAASPIETAFVMTLLNGVGIVACISKVWRQTGGRINDNIFRFSIGGER
ncbi:uncharacterized protein HMPREF1541_01471 [Cyphellophora europaea CBS 101466]|uniref:Uncharacterized protein n=1 Tax=Cyphellophora europaea (strain CBS 101466) TaxID=1220924 RepID=W2S0W6_CYPE1|nr:uncharacterized protein HMPREF1541_01471 [Cyphellophora europaea CBS 101466]ETN42317.1 hypothetical protein HMPREF1541_01471 [Cyphellophora europaea CBS 101466]